VTQSNLRKPYPLHDSPFFKLRGRGQLTRLLRVEYADLSALGERGDYRVWFEKEREIQAPTGRLAAVHRRIASLLKRIEVPDYVYSRRGRSHIDNAAQHCGPFPLVKTDVSRFYPNTTREMVLRLFRDDFQCAPDIAHDLANVCCYARLHLPTGSPISGYVAFLASKPMFDAVNSLADNAGCIMSTFVDDIAISGADADMRLLLKVRRLIRSAGYKTKSSKSRTYGWDEPKQLTGTIVTPDGLKLPNRQYKRIRDTRRMLSAVPVGAQHQRLVDRLTGQIVAANQVLQHPQSARRWLS